VYTEITKDSLKLILANLMVIILLVMERKEMKTDSIRLQGELTTL